jgi:Pyruvate/2-oxoacid:ferredoxin oxidoreductase gamma subunit
MSDFIRLLAASIIVFGAFWAIGGFDDLLKDFKKSRKRRSKRRKISRAS